MSEPNHVAMTEMDLLAKSETIQTMIVGIGDQRRRTTILAEFADRYKDVPEMCSVLWSADDNLKKAPSTCNGSIVILAIGAKADQSGSQPAFEIPCIYVLPREALGKWSEKHLKVTYSQFNGHYRILGAVQKLRHRK